MKQLKQQYLLDRDTDIIALAEEIINQDRKELIEFLKEKQALLHEKDLGEYFIVDKVIKLKEGELAKMERFFRGPVVEYYTRQSRDIWTEKVSHSILSLCTDELKRRVGFILYDEKGYPTEEVNSITSFKRVKDFRKFLEDIENVCFKDNDYIFPDSKHFKELTKEKGIDSAMRQVISELFISYKNKFFNQEIV